MNIPKQLLVKLIIVFLVGSAAVYGFAQLVSLVYRPMYQSAGDYAFFIMVAGAFISLAGIYPMLLKRLGIKF